jgi:hypothetical protein
MTTKDIIELSISLFSALLVFGGLMYAGRQLQLTRVIHKQDHDWNRRHAAQQAIYNYTTFVTGTQLLNKELGFATAIEALPIEKIREAFEKNSELRITCHQLLNFNEALAVGIIHGIYDEEVIKSAWRGNMLRSFDSFRNYITDIRQKGREHVFAEQEMIGNRWRNEITNRRFRVHTDTSR